NVVGDADLAEVVEGGGGEEDVEGVLIHARRAADQAREVAHAHHVVAARVVPVLGGAAEAADHLVQVAGEGPGAGRHLGVEAQVAVHPGEHQGRVQGPCQVVPGALGEAPAGIRHGVGGGDQQHRDAQVRQLPAEFEGTGEG